LLAIFIACLGLFGLSSFNAEQRIKEIGIRKTLGAKVSGIVILLNKELFILLLIANLISWPLAYILLNYWMQSFPYKAGIGIITFLAAGGLTFLVSLLTVSFQSLKASFMNPVDSLRYE
ncbi:MAG: ABC transporter permease, partial [bacterium]|nr:ABC transporter permease [bacterium]